MINLCFIHYSAVTMSPTFILVVNLIGAASVWVGTKNESNHLIINGHTFTQAAVEHIVSCCLVI